MDGNSSLQYLPLYALLMNAPDILRFAFAVMDLSITDIIPSLSFMERLSVLPLYWACQAEKPNISDVSSWDQAVKYIGCWLDETLDLPEQPLQKYHYIERSLVILEARRAELLVAI